MFQFIHVCFLFLFGFNLCQCLDEAWYSYQSSVRNANREELVIKNVTAERSYAVKSNVTRWKSLTIGPTCYSVGLLETGINILITDLFQNRTGFDIGGPGEIDLKEKPSDVMIFHNRINGQSEAVLVVSFVENSNLLWIKLTPNKIVIDFWSWSLEDPIIHINSLNMKGKQIMLAVSDNMRANLYEFDIKSEYPTYWYLQSLDLSTLTTSSAFSYFDSEFFLAIPQASFNSVLIYKYADSHFVYQESIVSPKVTTVTSFEIGFKSFLAVDGYNSGIYEFSKDGLQERKITNSNAEGIHYWLPVPIQTYRDEVIIFAQRSLDHGTHKTYAVEIITYNGGQFEEHEDVPCSLFEQTSPWLTCLTYDNGIIGASYLAIGDKLGLIVSKPSNSSFITFMVHSAMKSMPHPKTNELDLLDKHKDSLQTLIEEQMKEYEELVNIKSKLILDLTDRPGSEEHIVGAPEDDILKYEEEIQTLGLEVDEAMKKIRELKEKENHTEFDSVIVNGILRIQGNLDVGQVKIENINEQPATELLEDIARKDGFSKLLKNKTFTDLKADDLNFEVVNGINASNIVFNDDDEMVLKGNIVFENPVIINETSIQNGQINDFDIREEVVEIRKGYDGILKFEEIAVVNKMQAMKINNLNLHPINGTPFEDDGKQNDETSFIPHNISVTTINGIDFFKFVKDLCLVNVKCYISGNTTIIQNATVNEMHTNYLNDLKFPEEFILADFVSHANITGRKNVEGTLGAIEIRSEGTIGGVDTNKLVTLSTNQHIPGKLTFKDLELTEELNVTGKILGEHISKFMSNPTLKETDLIKSNVNFRRLEVEGNITLGNDFNAESFEDLLKDFVYLDEEIPEVTGTKIFPKGLTVQGNLEIESKSINNVNLDSLVTKDSEQNLHMNFLNGAVTIENLHVNGTYDGINIAQFDESLVKLTGEQFIASTLIFTDDVVVENLEVTGKLNELEAGEYSYTSGDIEISNDMAFDKIMVENLLVQGNLTGNISNLDLLDFSKRYMSFTKNQTIDAQFHLGLSDVDNLNAENVNGLHFGELFNRTLLLDAIEQMLNNRTSKVENLRVGGSIDLKTINNKNVDEIISRNLLKTETGSIKKELIFENDLYFNNLEIDKLSSVVWNDFVHHIVFKNETTLDMSGTKTFIKGIAVGKLIETIKIDGIHLNDILTKEGSQQIKGPLIIRANVSFEDSVVSGSINKTPIKDIFDSINVTGGVRVHKGDMVFERVAHIKNLIVNGTVNDKLPNQLLQTIVYKNSDVIMEKEIIFKKPVNVSGNIHTHFINNINLTDIKSVIVLTTTDADISGLVSFSKPVLIKNHMEVDESFITEYLFGFNTNEWWNKAVFLNKGLLNGNYSFEAIVINEELLTTFINDIDMSKIIPLRSDQKIGTLEIGEVSYVNNISVGHLVNGFKLSAAFENTVMGNLNQEVDSDIIFENNILVRQFLTASTINGKNSSKIVTTNTDQNLTSIFNFTAKCTVESELEVHGLINQINFTLWKNDNLRLFSNKGQDVTNQWNIAKNFSFSDDVSGNSSIGGLDLPQISKEVAERRGYKYKFEKGIIDDYSNICIDVTYLYEKTKTQIYKFKYFDDLQQLSFQHNIKHVFYFDHKNFHYLLINEMNCLSHMFVFNGSRFRLLIENIGTGSIEQVIPVFDEEEDVFLVIRGFSREEKCNVVGTNIWKLTNNSINLVMTMDDQLLLQESLLPATFYAYNIEGVTEYKMKKGIGGYKKYRKWEIFEDNVAFMPRGLKTGLALRTGRKIIYLDQSDPIIEDNVDDDVEITIRGESRSIDNYFIPGKNGSELVVLTVGMKSARKRLLAIATHEETVIKARLDFVKIYENGIKGELFDKVPTHKASSLLSIEFEQSETLLVFLENKRVLQVYEYKGIEGFKHRSSVKIQGSKLFQMSLPIKSSLNSRKTIGIIQKNKIRLIQAVMDGNLIKGDLNCGL